MHSNTLARFVADKNTLLAPQEELYFNLRFLRFCFSRWLGGSSLYFKCGPLDLPEVFLPEHVIHQDLGRSKLVRFQGHFQNLYVVRTLQFYHLPTTAIVINNLTAALPPRIRRSRRWWALTICYLTLDDRITPAFLLDAPLMTDQNLNLPANAFPKCLRR